MLITLVNNQIRKWALSPPHFTKSVWASIFSRSQIKLQNENKISQIKWMECFVLEKRSMMRRDHSNETFGSIYFFIKKEEENVFSFPTLFLEPFPPGKSYIWDVSWEFLAFHLWEGDDILNFSLFQGFWILLNSCQFDPQKSSTSTQFISSIKLTGTWLRKKTIWLSGKSINKLFPRIFDANIFE